jgi:hypothetical protein
MNIEVGWVSSSEPLLPMMLGKFCPVHKQSAMPALPRETGVPRCIPLVMPGTTPSYSSELVDLLDIISDQVDHEVPGIQCKLLLLLIVLLMLLLLRLPLSHVTGVWFPNCCSYCCCCCCCCCCCWRRCLLLDVRTMVRGFIVLKLTNPHEQSGPLLSEHACVHCMLDMAHRLPLPRPSRDCLNHRYLMLHAETYLQAERAELRHVNTTQHGRPGNKQQ